MTMLRDLTHFQVYPTCCRCDAGDSSGAAKFYKKAAEPYKPLLAHVVKDAFGNDNSMSDEVLDNGVDDDDVRFNTIMITLLLGVWQRERQN